jgi:hypothetical protein
MQRDYWTEEKMDGYRVTIVKTPLGRIRAAGKDPSIDLWEKIKYLLSESVDALENNSVLDGELYVPGGRATQVVTAYKAKDKFLRYCCFAHPIVAGEDRRNSKYTGRDLVNANLGLESPRIVANFASVEDAKQEARRICSQELRIFWMVEDQEPF